MYDYIGRVPRRINAWCDLALVAGFAEGRQEIDGEFIDLVITPQGGSLEGGEGEESTISADLAPLPEITGSRLQAADNGIEATLQDLSERLTRLEGLVLEMTSQLMPVLMRTLPQESPADEPGKITKIAELAKSDLTPEKSPDQGGLRPRRRYWWGKIREK